MGELLSAFSGFSGEQISALLSVLSFLNPEKVGALLFLWSMLGTVLDKPKWVEKSAKISKLYDVTQMNVGKAKNAK